jgi:hypothetical protein
MRLAGILSGSRMRSVRFDPAPANAGAWAGETSDGATRLVLLNKHADQKLQISIPSAHNAKLWRLLAPGLTATSEVTLAGSQIKPGTSWQPRQEEHLTSANRQVKIELPPSSGAALFFEGSL